MPEQSNKHIALRAVDLLESLEGTDVTLVLFTSYSGEFSLEDVPEREYRGVSDALTDAFPTGWWCNPRTFALPWYEDE